MTKDRNIALAKQYDCAIISSIAQSAGIDVKSQDVFGLLLDETCPSFSKPSEVITVLGIKRCIDRVLNNTDEPISLWYLQSLNEQLCNGLLNYKIGIRNEVINMQIEKDKVWMPKISTHQELKEELSALNLIREPALRAVSIAIWLLDRAIFYNANTALAIVILNKELINNSLGLYLVTRDEISEWKETLDKFHEDRQSDKEIRKFLQKNIVINGEIIKYPAY